MLLGFFAFLRRRPRGPLLVRGLLCSVPSLNQRRDLAVLGVDDAAQGCVYLAGLHPRGPLGGEVFLKLPAEVSSDLLLVEHEAHQVGVGIASQPRQVGTDKPLLQRAAAMLAMWVAVAAVVVRLRGLSGWLPSAATPTPW